ncbi:MAG: hypothetical protein HY319_16455 [Armatimonadetes bacterium]|nr:hypothetical protein [Armatimonadota bacterium]
MEGRSRRPVGCPVLFVILTVLFTLLGQRPGQHWTYIDQDQQGYRYYVDSYSLREVEPGVMEFALRKTAADGSDGTEPQGFRSFRLDCRNRTLLPLDGNGEAECIPPGTVAHSLLLYVQELSAARSSPPPAVPR